MQSTFLVFAGAGIGGALRHGVNVACARACGPAFPWGTLTVNILGSLAMGLIAGWLLARADATWSQPLRLFLTTGLLGGFTTFSTFSLDTAVMWERGQAGLAAVYVAASVAGALGALALGLALARIVS